jgi:CRP/FNR family cyclic AMP-dependent transcriptional regulator
VTTPNSTRGADATRHELTLAALRSSALFRRLPDRELARVADRMARRRYRRGEVIFHEGDPGDALHLVTAGRVKIARVSVDGAEAIVTTLGRGDVFGELVLLDGAPRSASATALEPTDTLTLSRSDFVAIVDADAEFRWSLFAGIAQHHRRLTDQLAEAHFLDLPGRLARQLARLAGADERYPDDDRSAPAELRLGRLYTQTELASMIGGTRPRVNQLMGEFVDGGLVRVEPNDIVILDLGGLLRRAEW